MLARIDRVWWGLLGGLATGIVLTLIVTTQLLPGLERTGLEEGVIKILTGEDNTGQRQAMIDLYNSIPGNPTAELVPITGGATAQYAQMVSVAQSEQSDIDIFNLDVPMMETFIKHGHIRKLDTSELDVSGFLKVPLDTCYDESKENLYGLPFNTDAGMLFFNTDLFKDQEPPKDWKSFTETVAKLDGGVAGYVGQLDASYEGLTVNAMEIIVAAGGIVVDDDGDVKVDDPKTRDGLQWLARGLTHEPRQILPEATGYDEDASRVAFAEGKAVFMRNWPIHHSLLTKVPNEPGATPPVPFGLARLPWRSVLGGQNLVISAHTDQPRAAQDLIEFLTDAHRQQLLFERGGFAATRELVYQYRSQEFNDKYPYIDMLVAAINDAIHRPRTAHYIEFSEAFREGVKHAMEHDGQLPDGFATKLSNAIKGIQP